MDDFNFFAHKELIDAFKKNKPYLLDLEVLIKEINYGKLNLTFTVMNGKVTSVEVGSHQLVRYDKGERIEEEEEKKDKNLDKK
jgi:hypothetical protein